MDKLEYYRSSIQTILETYSQYKPRNKEVENELFLDITLKRATVFKRYHDF